jgi:hypothetical protein
MSIGHGPHWSHQLYAADPEWILQLKHEGIELNFQPVKHMTCRFTCVSNKVVQEVADRSRRSALVA